MDTAEAWQVWVVGKVGGQCHHEAIRTLLANGEDILKFAATRKSAERLTVKMNMQCSSLPGYSRNG
ncbi:hypothetical protein ABVK25_003205 [Lepraria finkii]|uniref:Uncharacterized protein n=1 Tax=Lepraria finkii TaxID=1340010 RepID=A0ABR4BG46_9LECA